MSGVPAESKTRSEILLKLLSICLVLAPSILITLVVWGYWADRNFPWWTDGGNWLKHTNAILGKTNPMWDEGTYQYPPLFFMLLGVLIELTGDPLFSIKLLGLACLFIFPPAMFLLSKEAFRSSITGIVVAWLTAFYPLFLEFVGWGGYPNILGFALLSLTFNYTMKFVEGKSLRSGVIASIFILAVILTHHLTSLILVGTLALWTIFSFGFSGFESRKIAVLLIVTFSAFLIYRTVLAWPPDFVFFNEAAYYRLRASIDPYYVFKSPIFLILFLIAFVAGIPILISKAGDFRSRFLAAWILTPLIGTQGYLLRIALDYNRIFFFLYQPLLLLVSASASCINSKLIDLSKYSQTPEAFLKSFEPEHAVQLVSLVVVLLLVSSNTLYGLTTISNINYWYNGIDLYGDEDKFGAVSWLKNNTDDGDVIVAEEPIGRWIEGVSERRVLLHTPPMFLFMRGEWEREYAARALLISQYGIRSKDVWIFEQASHGYMSPMIAFRYLGDYVNTVFHSAKDSYVLLIEDSKTETVNFIKAATKVEWLSRSTKEPSLLVRREAAPVEISEKLSLKPNQTITLDFNITKPNDATIMKTVLAFNFTRDLWILSNPRSPAPLILTVQTNIGEIIFSSDNNYTVVYENLPVSRRLNFFFNEASFKLEVRLKEVGNSSCDVETYTRDEVAKDYSVRYLVLPKLPLEGHSSTVTWVNTRPEYSHLLNSSLLKSQVLTIAFQNERVIVLKYVGKQ